MRVGYRDGFGIRTLNSYQRQLGSAHTSADQALSGFGTGAGLTGSFDGSGYGHGDGDRRGNGNGTPMKRFMYTPFIPLRRGA